MTGLRKYEKPPQPSNRPSPGLLLKRAHQSQVVSSSVRLLLLASSFLGYAIVSLALIAVALELMCWPIWYVLPAQRQQGQRASPVYAGADWASEFWKEETLRQQTHKEYIPFRLWGVTKWNSKYINNDPGAGGVWRRTVNPANCDAPHRVIVWIFGGSTTYGTAVPDWATIPSYLSGDLNAASGNCVVVSNFGVEGYVTDQELILLVEQLKAGGHPHIVVFYDGVNDSALAWPPSGSPMAHPSFGTIKSRVEGTLSGRLDFLRQSYAVRVAYEVLAHLHQVASFSPLVSKAQPNVFAVVNNYEANLKIARALGDAYHFKLYCFWQPMLTYGKKPLVPFEQRMATADADGASVESAWLLTMASVYREEERRAAQSGEVVFLGTLFDSIREPIYVDEAHLGPMGNKLAAQAIASYIRDHPEK
jgi:lysophospholipase L1-like esterase